MKEYIIKGLIVIMAVLAPIKPMLIACVFLIIADMITGIFAAYKRKEKISSAEMRRSVTKLVVYQIAIIAAFVLEKYMLGGILPVAKIVAGVIGMVEMKSILENVSAIAGQDILAMVINKLGFRREVRKNSPVVILYI